MRADDNSFDMSSIYDLDMGGVVTYVPQNVTFLTVITIAATGIGIVLSTVAMLMLLLTAALFAEWRKIYKNQLLIQFMIAKFVYTAVRYFYDLRISFVDERPEGILYIDFFLRFYTEMVLVAWMYVFTKHMYECLVKVFNVNNQALWKVSLCVWFIPVGLAGLLYLFFLLQCGKEIQIYMIYLILVKWPVLAANAILLILATKSILKCNKSKTESNIRIVVVMIVLVFAFCFQQFIVDIYKAICTFLFFQLNRMPNFMDYGVVTLNVLALFYCAFSILFWLFGNAQTRKLWMFRNNRLSPQNSLSSRISIITK